MLVMWYIVCMLDLFIGNPSVLPLRIFMLFAFMYGFSERVRSATDSSARLLLKASQNLILGVWWVIKYPAYIALWIGMNVIFPLTFLIGIGMMIFFLLPILAYGVFEAIVVVTKLFLFGVWETYEKQKKK